jgi:threonine synthase
MNYHSTRNRSIRIPLRDVIVSGIAADGGLFMPDTIRPMPLSWFENVPESLREIGFDVASQLIGDDIPQKDLRSIIDEALSFDIKVVPLDGQTWALELFHGPTLAFKDFGARFLAALMEYYARDIDKEIIVLAATSGDTGSAVANGFLNKKGIRVIILYPSGKVSPLQEKQLTTLGGNVSAWEVEGTFDDCQRLVKQMFSDDRLRKKFLLTSANSINFGRLGAERELRQPYSWRDRKEAGPAGPQVRRFNKYQRRRSFLPLRVGIYGKTLHVDDQQCNGCR